MNEATTLLFGLDGFRVVSVVALDDSWREVLVEGTAAEQAGPGCGVMSGRMHSRAM